MTAQESDIDRLSRKLAAEQASHPADHFDYLSIASDLDGLVQPILDAIAVVALAVAAVALLESRRRGRKRLGSRRRG